VQVPFRYPSCSVKLDEFVDEPSGIWLTDISPVRACIEFLQTGAVFPSTLLSFTSMRFLRSDSIEQVSAAVEFCDLPSNCINQCSSILEAPTPHRV